VVQEVANLFGKQRWRVLGEVQFDAFQKQRFFSGKGVISGNMACGLNRVIGCADARKRIPCVFLSRTCSTYSTVKNSDLFYTKGLILLAGLEFFGFNVSNKQYYHLIME
jgi:hypothetical protein